MDTTSYGLIQLVKERETIPDSGSAYDEQTLLNYLDQSLKGFIVPAIEATLEEHFVVTQDIQMPTLVQNSGGVPPDNVGNVIKIPGESTGMRLRDVYMVGNDGNFFNLPRLTAGQAASYSFGQPYGPSIGSPQQFVGGFYLQSNSVIIYPYALASNKIVRITYQKAPLDLILTSQAGKVIAKSGLTITIDKVLSNWKAGDKVNVISGEMPHDFVDDSMASNRVYCTPKPLQNIEIDVITANTLRLKGSIDSVQSNILNVQVGDWICPQGYSVYPQNIPRELYPVLIQKAAEMCLEAAGDREGQQSAKGTYTDMMKLALMQIAPRVIGKPIKILPTNSAFRASRMSNFGRY